MIHLYLKINKARFTPKGLLNNCIVVFPGARDVVFDFSVRRHHVKVIMEPTGERGLEKWNRVTRNKTQAAGQERRTNM
jgi:hypothetical protein